MKKILFITLLLTITFMLFITPSASTPAFSLNSDINSDTLTITINSNTSFSAFNLKLYYDAQVLTPISLQECEILKTGDAITTNINGKNYTDDYVSAVWIDLNDTKKYGDIFKVTFKLKQPIKSTTLKLICTELIQNDKSITNIPPIEFIADISDAENASPAISTKSNADKIRYMNDYGNEFKPLAYATRYEIIDALYSLFEFKNINDTLKLTDIDDNYKTKAMPFLSTGIISGYPDGSFRGNNNITRAEFVKLLTMAFKFNNSVLTKDYFSDISNSWAKSYINNFASMGYAKGYLNPDGTFSFKPNDFVTRAECVLFINRIINASSVPSNKIYIDLTSDFWGYDEIMKAVK